MTIKKAVNVETRAVTFDFGNGQTAMLNLSELSPDIVTRLALHGLSQKAGDSYAGAKSAVEDGDAESVEAYAANQVSGIWDQLKAGTWAAAREGTGGPRVTLLVEAYARIKGCDIEQAQEAIGQLTDEEQKQVRKIPAIVKAMAAIKAERLVAKAKATTDDATGLEKFNL